MGLLEHFRRQREVEWYRLIGRNPGSMLTPQVECRWSRDPDDPYFGEVVDKALAEHGYPYIPPDHPRGNPLWHEQWASPPHLTMESRLFPAGIDPNEDSA